MMYKITCSSLCAWVVVILCFIVFTGWQLDFVILRSLVPGAPQTTPLTALMLLMLGVALILSSKNITRQSTLTLQGRFCTGLSAIVLTAAIYTGLQYLFHLDPTIELFLYPELVTENGGDYPGRPSPQTVLSAVLMSGAIGLSPLPGVNAKRTTMFLAIASLMVTWLVLFGYASTTNPFFSIPHSPETGMSPITTAGFLALIIGSISLRPDEGLAKLLTASSSGGRLVRILLPIVIVIPLIFGWIVIYGREQGLFDTSLGFALNWGLTSLLFAGMLVWQGFILHEHDTEKDKIAKEREKMLSDLEHAADKIKQQADELERSNLDLQQFAYVASHDLQAPLRGISGFVQLLKTEYEGKLDDTAEDWIDRIIKSTVQMQTLIQDLLAYSRVDSQAIPLQAASMKDIFNEAVALLEAPITSNKAKVTCDDLPEVMCNEARLVQLLQNLIGNALKYHGENTPEVHVSSMRNGNEWHFSVRDNGIGIDPAYHARIFEIFSRLHNQKEYSGTGIGLAICRRIVHRHGGRIWLESRQGKGTTFYFTIPILENSNG